MNFITNKVLILGSLLVLVGCASSKSKKDESAASGDKSKIEAIVSEDFKTEELTGDSDTGDLTKKSGSFNYSGSEPFVRPTFFVSGDEAYLLVGDENFIKNEYKNLNGKSGSVFGKIENQRYFKVYFYKINEDS